MGKIKKDKVHPSEPPEIDRGRCSNSFPCVIHLLDNVYLEAFNYNLIREKKTIYYEQIKCLYKWMEIFGKWPLIQCKDDSFEIPLSSWMYSIVIYIVLLIMNLTTSKDLLTFIVINASEKLNGLGPRYNSGLFVSTFLFFIYWNISAPVVDWLFINKNAAFLNKWKDFQDLYYIRTGQELKFNHKKKVNLSVFITILIISIMVLYGAEKLTTNISWYSKIAICIGCTDVIIFILLWWYTCQIISEAGKQTNELLIQNLNSGNGLNWVKIHNFRVIWIELTNICDLLCSVYEYKVLICIVAIVMCFIVNSYHIILRLQEPDDSIKPYIFMLIYSSISVFLLCEGGSKIYKTVGEEFCENIYVKCNFLSLTFEERFEIESLMYIIQNKPPVIIISSYLTFNRKLMFQILSISLTAIIILVQFKAR